MIRVVVLLAVAGCHFGEPVVTRTLAGERREGAFVSPFEYEHFLRAELAVARGDDAEAVEEYAMARLGVRDDALIASRQAEALDRLGRVERADAVLDEARELDARSESVALASSRIAERRGDPETALREAVRATEIAPRSADAWRRLTELSAGTERAPELLRRLGDDPTSLRARLALAVAADDAPGAEEALEALRRVAPVHTDEIADVVELALRRGRPTVAAHLAERLASAPALRVRALLAAGRRTDAEGVLATEAPEAFEGVLPLAKLWLAAGRPETAAELAREALALGDPQAATVAAEAELALGRGLPAAVQASKVRPGASGHAHATQVLTEAIRSVGSPALAGEVAAAAPGR
ncbi:MAG: hypothetical protein H6721_25425 [Sandaracinus sp.]|nr:hypothetical protein [Sandaracinus sp.]MCB9620434.1 hypothetical protein [Sandaracinus sp.]MCB9635475.1 hypothetical protein [Sandaracinus sp.]